MFPISSAQVPAVLKQLLEYARLLEEYRRCILKGCPPPLSVRIPLKQHELRLPSNLAQYLHLLRKHPSRGNSKPLASVTPNGQCESCHGAVPTSWIARIRQQQGIFTCENCGALLLPTTKD